MGKNPPAIQETRVPSLGQEDLLKKGMATHSSILSWRMFHVHLRRMCILLLLDGMLYKLSPSGLSFKAYVSLFSFCIVSSIYIQYKTPKLNSETNILEALFIQVYEFFSLEIQRYL